MDPDHWLNRILNEIDQKELRPRVLSSSYGVDEIAARYCGFSSAPSPVPGHWQHGWTAEHRRLTPQYEMGVLEPLNPNDVLWVSRLDQEQFLRQSGFMNTRAIGLPCVYVPDSQQDRHADSLLVMPAHSLDYTRHNWKLEEYADQIEALRSDFEEMVVCVHQSCFQRGLWVDSFRKRGIPVITGAHTSDPLTLYRLEAMMSSFGFLTTNSHGSHIAYGAYWGAKVSIFGTYANRRPEDSANSPFFQTYPELLEPVVKANNEEAMRKTYPQLFVDHPRDAQNESQWGCEEVGDDCKLSPGELAGAFRWAWHQRVAKQVAQVTRRVTQAVLPRSIRNKLHQKLHPEIRRQHAFDLELHRIASSPDHQIATTGILENEIAYRSGPSCADAIRSVFVEEIFRFPSVNGNPLIVDMGAGIGLTSIYFARLYPQATILAAEQDAELCQLLELNCAAFGLNNVTIHRGVYLPNDPSGVPGPMLNPPWLDQPIDFLKLDIGGKEVEWLERHLEQISNVKRLFLEYRCDFLQKQQLRRLFEILDSVGLRCHLKSLHSANQPFVYRPVQQGMDMQCQIFAFRELA